MSENLILWAVYTNDDLTEGRGRQYIKHFCKTRATAVRLAKGGYVMGTDCPVEPVEALFINGMHVLPTSFIPIVYPSRDDEIAQQRMDERRQVLEKAKALGLTDDDIAALVKGSRHV